MAEERVVLESEEESVALEMNIGGERCPRDEPRATVGKEPLDHESQATVFLAQATVEMIMMCTSSTLEFHSKFLRCMPRTQGLDISCVCDIRKRPGRIITGNITRRLK